MKRRRTQGKRFAICIMDSEPDLARGKVYEILPDSSAARNHYLRVVDESGEDYLYPSHFFVVIKLPQEAEQALARVS